MVVDARWCGAGLAILMQAPGAQRRGRHFVVRSWFSNGARDARPSWLLERSPLVRDTGGLSRVHGLRRDRDDRRVAVAWVVITMEFARRSWPA